MFFSIVESRRDSGSHVLQREKGRGRGRAKRGEERRGKGREGTEERGGKGQGRERAPQFPKV